MPYNNLEQKKEYMKEYWIKNKDILSKKKKEYDIKNKDILSKNKKEYYFKNKEHILARSKIWALNNKDRVRENQLKRDYNLTLDQYNKMLADQNGCCKGCGIKFDVNIKSLTPHVDHCHKTGKVRGLLCNYDNTIIGYANEDTARLSKLIEYIKEHNE